MACRPRNSGSGDLHGYFSCEFLVPNGGGGGGGVCDGVDRLIVAVVLLLVTEEEDEEEEEEEVVGTCTSNICSSDKEQ